MKQLLPAVLLCMLAAPAGAQEQETPLAAFEPLVGNCYVASGGIDDGEDRHCWSETANGEGVLQRQLITGGTLDGFAADAIYRVDPETGIGSFRYRTNSSGKSRGTFTVQDGNLIFPDEVYEPGDGSVVRMYTVFTIYGADRYTVEGRQGLDGGWEEPILIEFARLEP